MKQHKVPTAFNFSSEEGVISAVDRRRPAIDIGTPARQCRHVEYKQAVRLEAIHPEEGSGPNNAFDYNISGP